ncbi:albusnodin/ikarugamycin family macrolactam cyclase [Promicromonospora panici]|uniref:albusnodin/ikarugamycin family macrolactam cyclase n=1 Tax=Promicromonospora panici TaxID=2219658 RepID=UPI00101D5BEA|nr:albusnodin/ikarugamycin family macrolactam cyclase [Promicromonospora panici]
MHWLAGSFSAGSAWRPAGSVSVDGAADLWLVGDPPQAWLRTANAPMRRVVVVGTCGAGDDELNRLASSGVPDDVALRWPGAYAVVEQTKVATTIWTDLASSVPVYTTLLDGTVYWATTARGLAGLTGAAVNSERLAVELLAPSSPLLAGITTYFEAVELVPAGHRMRVTSSETTVTRVWWPGQEPSPGASLRAELDAAVGVRVDDAVSPSSDLSGGLDSSSLTLLAAHRLSPDRSVAAFTVHAPFDRPAGDLRYALDAAERPGVAHHLLPLEAGHLPYSNLDTVPATDEPAPSTRAYARFARQMTAMVGRVGTDAHLTGDGGDSLLGTPDAWIADLFAAGRYREASNEVVRLARMRRHSPRRVLSDVLDSLRSDPADVLSTWARLARGQVSSPRAVRRLRQLLPLLDQQLWATPMARHHAAIRADQAAESALPAPTGQRAVWDVVEQMAEVGRTAYANAQLAAEFGVHLHNPFADSRVIDSYLSGVAGRMPSPAAYKPILRAEMAGILPTSLLARTTKGVYTPDYHLGLRTHLSNLSSIVDGHLAERGLIDPAGLVNGLRRAAAELTGGLWLLDAAITCETWLRAHHSTPLPAWENIRENVRSEALTP